MHNRRIAPLHNAIRLLATYTRRTFLAWLDSRPTSTSFAEASAEVARLRPADRWPSCSFRIRCWPPITELREPLPRLSPIRTLLCARRLRPSREEAPLCTGVFAGSRIGQIEIDLTNFALRVHSQRSSVAASYLVQYAIVTLFT